MSPPRTEQILPSPIPPQCSAFRAALNHALDEPDAAAGEPADPPQAGHRRDCPACCHFETTMRRLHDEARLWAGIPTVDPPTDLTSTVMEALRASRPRVRVSGAVLALLVWSCCLAGGLLLARGLARTVPTSSLSWMEAASGAAAGLFAELSDEVEIYFDLPLSMADRGLLQIDRIPGPAAWSAAAAITVLAALALRGRRAQRQPAGH